MIERSVSDILRKYASWFPVVSVTGPRQSGKSTLVQSVFSDYSYVNLELPGDLEAANADPLGFIRSHPAPLIIDEAQLAPELFNVIQVESDRAGTPGQYILSGSQNFLLRRQITQSLAGRVGILTLPPLSFRELACAGKAPKTDDYLVRGGYPRLYNIEIPSDVYYSNYVTTYLDRDVSGLVNPQNLTLFNTFLKIIASSAGSLLNITSLANETGVTTKTMRAWLSILEQSYIVFTLQPYHANLRKRLVKTPKLYFYDTGLLCHLLGYTDALDAERTALGQAGEHDGQHLVRGREEHGQHGADGNGAGGKQTCRRAGDTALRHDAEQTAQHHHEDVFSFGFCLLFICRDEKGDDPETESHDRATN